MYRKIEIALSAGSKIIRLIIRQLVSLGVALWSFVFHGAPALYGFGFTVALVVLQQVLWTRLAHRPNRATSAQEPPSVE